MNVKNKWNMQAVAELSAGVLYLAAIIVAWMSVKGVMTAFSVWPDGTAIAILLLSVWTIAAAYGLVYMGDSFRAYWKKPGRHGK